MKYLIANRSTDILETSYPFDNETDITSLVHWQLNSPTKYIIEFAESYDFSTILAAGVVTTVSTTDDKDLTVTNYTLSYDYTVHNKDIKSQIPIMIIDWCKTQPELCERAFINSGILNGSGDVSYQTYISEIANITSGQTALLLP